MRKTLFALLLAAFVVSCFASCATFSHGSATCPSHDPNYFRKGK